MLLDIERVQPAARRQVELLGIESLLRRGAVGVALGRLVIFAIALGIDPIHFGIIVVLSRRGYDAELLSDFKGLNARSPWFALMMMFLMFSMAGVPPFIGFFGKLNVIDAVLSAGHPGLAVLMVVASVVGAYYYLRVIWYMYFEEGEDKAVLQSSMDTRLVLSLNSVAVLALGILPGGLLALCVSVLA